MSVSYQVSFAPKQHLIHIEATALTHGAAEQEWLMAVWTPGSYMVREYARHVEGLQASDAEGKPLSVDKTRKNRWRVACAGAAEVRLSYSVYCREMTVRNNWVDQDFALLNGAPTFITCAQQQPHHVHVKLAPGWKHCITALAPHASGAPTHYSAADFDTLVDSPLLCGNPALYEFTLAGKPHLLATEGEAGVWDGARAAADMEKLVRQAHALWGQVPYERYTMINLLTEGRGGLEHKNSAVLMASRWATRTPQDYTDWLGLVSHEFFHVWNIKRLRPVELGPFDYEQENPTRSLWIAEGFTAYYDDLLVCRAGLATPKEYFERLSKSIEHLQCTPGRLLQPLQAASFDAWIKFYRRDENTDNTAVSYYIKGSLVGFLLDAKIRAASGGSKSLDHVMRAAYAQYAGARGFTEAQFRSLAQEISGVDLSAFFARAVDSTEELDYREALDLYGLTFKRPDDKEGAAPSAGWLGMSTRNDSGRLVVTQVLRDGPAYSAGINVDDELLGFDDFRVQPGRWHERLKQLGVGRSLQLLVARRDRLLRLTTSTEAEPGKAFELQLVPQPSEAQVRHLRGWLGDKARAGGNP